MEEQRSLAQCSSDNMNSKLEKCSKTSLDWNEKMYSQLNSTHNKIDTFITEEIRKDIPTGYISTFNYEHFFLFVCFFNSNVSYCIVGTTPCRKEFSYPRHLAATSPHEKIIKRFREFRKQDQTHFEVCIMKYI